MERLDDVKRMDRKRFDVGINIHDLLVEVGLVETMSEARMLQTGGGVFVNGIVVNHTVHHIVNARDLRLPHNTIEIRAGRKRRVVIVAM